MTIKNGLLADKNKHKHALINLNDMENDNILLSVDEIANILKVQPATVRSLFRSGEIKAVKIGKKWFTTIDNLISKLD